MPAFAFDTHAAVKSLTGAGFDTKKAEAITDTLRDAVTESVATKGDVEALGHRLDRMDERFEKVEARLDRMDERFEKVEARLDRMDERMDSFATRKDLEAFATKAELNAGLANLKADMLKIAIVITLAIVSANTALTLALFTFLGGTN